MRQNIRFHKHVRIATPSVNVLTKCCVRPRERNFKCTMIFAMKICVRPRKRNLKCSAHSYNGWTNICLHVPCKRSTSPTQATRSVADAKTNLANSMHVPNICTSDGKCCDTSRHRCSSLNVRTSIQCTPLWRTPARLGCSPTVSDQRRSRRCERQSVVDLRMRMLHHFELEFSRFPEHKRAVGPRCVPFC